MDNSWIFVTKEKFHNLLRMTLLAIIYRLNKQNEIVKLVTKTVNFEMVLQYYAIFLVPLHRNYKNATSALQITNRRLNTIVSSTITF